MDSNTTNRSRSKGGNFSLSLSTRDKQRQNSSERQKQAREGQFAVNRPSSSEKALTGLDKELESLLRKKVHILVDAENSHKQLLERAKSLECMKSNGEIPKGLKIKKVIAKGKSGTLQDKFDQILKEAENRLLDASLESIRTEIESAATAITLCQKALDDTLSRWRTSFSTEAFSGAMEEKAEKMVCTAKSFIEQFYFECSALRTSKTLKETLNKEEKSKRHHSDNMDLEFQVSEKTIRDIVKAELQRATVKEQKTVGFQKPKKKIARNSRSLTRKFTTNSRQRSVSSNSQKRKPKSHSNPRNAGKRGRAQQKNGKSQGVGQGT